MSVENIYQCYQSLSTDSPIEWEGGQLHLLKYWFHPVCSLNRPDMSKVQTSSFRRSLEKLPGKFTLGNRIESSRPYLNIVSKQNLPDKKTRDLANQLGMQVYPSYQCLNLFTSVREPLGQLNCTVHVYDKTSPHWKKDYGEAMAIGFAHESPSKTRYILKAVEMACNPRIVVLKGKNGALIGSGSVFTKGKHAHLFAGSILPRYRSRGYWKLLLSVRQQVSYFLGARKWAHNTGSPYIRNIYDKQFHNHALF